MKKEKGVTLTGLVIYILFFSMALALTVNISSRVYGQLGKVNNNSISSEEFNKFNTEFVQDIKSQKFTSAAKNGTEGSTHLILPNGVNYTYISSEKAIYRNKEKIATNISSFTAIPTTKNGKNAVRVEISTGTGTKENSNFGKTIVYILRYWK